VRVSELRTALDRLQNLCISVSAKSAAADFKALSEALKPHGSKSVDQFCSQARSWLLHQAKKPKVITRTVRASRVDSKEITQRYVEQLRQSRNDRQLFERVFERLRADKGLKSADLSEVARQYANTVTKYKSKAAAHAAITAAFTEQARFINKLG
jgi:hypothetical protein